MKCWSLWVISVLRNHAIHCLCVMTVLVKPWNVKLYQLRICQLNHEIPKFMNNTVSWNYELCLCFMKLWNYEMLNLTNYWYFNEIMKWVSKFMNFVCFNPWRSLGDSSRPWKTHLGGPLSTVVANGWRAIATHLRHTFFGLAQASRASPDSFWCQRTRNETGYHLGKWRGHTFWIFRVTAVQSWSIFL